jgi:adenosylhomocysteine nucleosidase
MRSITHRVALLAPMRSELQPLIRPLGLRPPRSESADLWSGGVGRVEVVATITGIGTRAARHSAERVLGAIPVEVLLVVGVAGGIGPTVDIGDLVVPEAVLDLASGAEYHPHLAGTVTARGILATSDELLADPERSAQLEQRGVIAIDMETAAVAAVCEREGCPWSVFRAISDRADDASTDPAIFALADPDGNPNLLAVARFVLNSPGRVPQLARLARGLRVATRTAADAAVRVLQAM